MSLRYIHSWPKPWPRKGSLLIASIAMSHRSNRWLKPSPVVTSTCVALSTNSLSLARTYPKMETPITRKTSAGFQRRAKQRKNTYPVAIERPAPLEKTSAGIKLNAVPKQNQRPLLIRDRRNVIHPSPAAKTSSIEACPTVLGFHVMNDAALFTCWNPPRKFFGLLPSLWAI